MYPSSLSLRIPPSSEIIVTAYSAVSMLTADIVDSILLAAIFLSDRFSISIRVDRLVL